MKRITIEVGFTTYPLEATIDKNLTKSLNMVGRQKLGSVFDLWPLRLLQCLNIIKFTFLSAMLYI